MHINFNIYKKHNLTPEYLIQLLAVKQKQTEEINTDVLSNFEDLGYISYVKGKKNQDKRELVRLSDKGKKLFKDLGAVPSATNEDIIVKDWLIKYYKSLGKEIGSERRIEQYIINFRVEADIYKNNIILLLQDFLSDELVEESSKVLESVFFQKIRKAMDKNGNIVYYEVPWKLEESWLYNHYKRKEEYFKSIFEEY